MPAKSAPAKKAAAPAAKSTGTPSNGVYVGPIDVRNQTADEVRARFSAYGKIQQLRLKRTLKVARGPYALIWFKSTDDAKKAFNDIKKNEPEGTNVEWIKTAKPVQSRAEIATSIVVSPLSVPPRNSTGYGKLQKKIRELFPNAEKTRLHTEAGTGSALVYFKNQADAAAAKKKLDGKLFGRAVVVKPSLRTLAKDQKRFVEPLKARQQYQVALAKKQEERAKAVKEAKALAVIKDKETKAAALKKSLEAAKERARDAQKAGQEKAKSNAQAKNQQTAKTGANHPKGAATKTPPAKTAAKQPVSAGKTTSKKAQKK